MSSPPVCPSCEARLLRSSTPNRPVRVPHDSLVADRSEGILDYKVVFDVADAGYKSWTFPAFGLIFIAVGIALVVRRKRLPGRWSESPRLGSALSFFVLGF